MTPIEETGNAAFKFAKSDERTQKTLWIAALIIFFGWANYFLVNIHLRDDDKKESAFEKRDSIHVANERYWQDKYEKKSTECNDIYKSFNSGLDTLKKANYELIKKIYEKQ